METLLKGIKENGIHFAKGWFEAQLKGENENKWEIEVYTTQQIVQILDALLHIELPF